MILSSRIKPLATAAGFDLCGIAKPDVIDEARDKFDHWLADGYHNDMDWLVDSRDRRTDPRQLMDGVKSVIMLGVNYFQPNAKSVPEGCGRVARYARGRDYHKILAKNCKTLIKKIESEVSREAVPVETPEFKFWVDYGPFMERSYAVKAGLGYIGKSGMLINKRFGSWILLAEIVTNLELAVDQVWPGDHGRCGTCKRCIDACPTRAIRDEGVVDANRCLSYWTIESKGEIPNRYAGAMGDGVFGCDTCQQVCPHNEKRQKPTEHSEFLPEFGVGELLELHPLAELKDNETFLAQFAGTSLTRPKMEGIRRNALIVLDNQAKRR